MVTLKQVLNKLTQPRCPICGAFLTATTPSNRYDFGGQEAVNYYCKKCQAAGR